jgi:hypothetical protein
MPGVLGIRARFQKSFDQRNDPFARVRLAARVRPFLLRRTKTEVAQDLPERIEEDLYCEMEGLQATLYSAELKRARQMLLKISTSEDLDRDRFNILTSLLRLRQICCHPALVTETAATSESAKLTALLELLEPLMEEGHKVLVFSQFTSMLDLVAAAVRQRELAFLSSSPAPPRTANRSSNNSKARPAPPSSSFPCAPAASASISPPPATSSSSTLGGTPPSKTKPSTAPTASAKPTRSTPTASSLKTASKKKSATCRTKNAP